MIAIQFLQACWPMHRQPRRNAAALASPASNLRRNLPFLSSRSMNARAHWTSRWRIFLSPRLEIPSRVDLPPVLYCLGTGPTAAAKSRLHRYCFPESGIPSAIAQRQAIRLYFDHRKNPLRLRRILAVRQRLNIGMTVGMARYQVRVRPPVRHHGSYFDWRTARANGPER